MTSITKLMDTDSCKISPSFGSTSIDMYFIQLARRDKSITDSGKIFIVDFSQLSREPQEKEMDLYFEKISVLLHPSDIVVFLPFHRLQSSMSTSEAGEQSQGRKQSLNHFNSMMSQIEDHFSNTWQSIVYLEVSLESTTGKGTGSETFKDVMTGVIMGGGSKEEATGYFKWLLKQNQFLATPLLSGVPSLAWKERLRREEDNTQGNRGRELKPNQRHFDFWTKFFCRILLVKQYSRVVSIEKLAKKRRACGDANCG